MIQSLTIAFRRDFPNPEAWSMRIECAHQQGSEFVHGATMKNGTRAADFEGTGQLSEALAFIPKALKAMEIDF